MASTYNQVATIAKDTVDSVVWEALQMKDATQADLLLGLKRLKR
jgi:hypothetical protein